MALALRLGKCWTAVAGLADEAVPCRTAIMNVGDRVDLNPAAASVFALRLRSKEGNHTEDQRFCVRWLNKVIRERITTCGGFRREVKSGSATALCANYPLNLPSRNSGAVECVVCAGPTTQSIRKLHFKHK